VSWHISNPLFFEYFENSTNLFHDFEFEALKNIGVIENITRMKRTLSELGKILEVLVLEHDFGGTRTRTRTRGVSTRTRTRTRVGTGTR